jgi:hypothetical protein
MTVIHLRGEEAPYPVFLESGTDTCWLSTQVYTHLPTASQLFKELGCYITTVLSKEPAREPPVLYWFFHENCWFFKGFETVL